jgi:hypothetical protein
MYRRHTIAVLVGIALFVGGWAVAQQTPTSPKAGGEAPGRFFVVAVGDGAVLVDTATGQTWVFRPGVEGPRGMNLPPAWEPAKKIETSNAAEDWKDLEQKRRQDLEKRKAGKQQ